MFGVVGTGLKAKAFAIEFRNQKKRHPETPDNVIAKRVAGLINDDFGGLHLQRLGRNPTLQHIFRLLALAPDWTESNIRSMVKAIKSGNKDETRMYRDFWAGIVMKGVMATVLANMVMAMFDEDDDEGQGVLGRFIRNYTIAAGAGKFRWLDVDITPIVKALGGESADRYFFSILGHFKDPLKFAIRNKRAARGERFSTFGLFNPKALFQHKAAIMTKMLWDYVTGVDYKDAAFTTLKELIGKDDKGVYKRKTVKKGKTYLPGDPKGGQLAGQTVAWKWGGGGIVNLEQMPSFIINQIKGWQPVQVQQMLGYVAGELDGFMAIGYSLGLGISKTYGRKPTSETVADYKELPFKKALEHYKNASKEMRKKFLPYLKGKLDRSTSKTKEDVMLYKKMLAER